MPIRLLEIINKPEKKQVSVLQSKEFNSIKKTSLINVVAHTAHPPHKTSSAARWNSQIFSLTIASYTALYLASCLSLATLF